MWGEDLGRRFCPSASTRSAIGWAVLWKHWLVSFWDEDSWLILCWCGFLCSNWQHPPDLRPTGSWEGCSKGHGLMCCKSYCLGSRAFWPHLFVVYDSQLTCVIDFKMKVLWESPGYCSFSTQSSLQIALRAWHIVATKRHFMTCNYRQESRGSVCLDLIMINSQLRGGKYELIAHEGLSICPLSWYVRLGTRCVVSSFLLPLGIGSRYNAHVS